MMDTQIPNCCLKTVLFDTVLQKFVEQYYINKTNVLSVKVRIAFAPEQCPGTVLWNFVKY